MVIAGGRTRPNNFNGMVWFVNDIISSYKLVLKGIPLFFSKQAISCPLFKNRTLIWYQGDDSIVVDFAHGNRTVNNVEKPFTRTAPSVLEALKQDNNKFPSQIYSDFLLAAPNELDWHITDAPRDLKQVRNAQCAARQSQRLSSDGIYNLVELASETGFIHDIHVAPHLTIICFNEGKF